MFATLAELVSPAERLSLLDGVIFNVLVGAGGTAKLAPLYDVMCALVYRNVDPAAPAGHRHQDQF